MSKPIVSEDVLEGLSSPLLICPLCSSGSSEMTNDAFNKNIWCNISCRSCGESIEIATIIDEMFANNERGCYSIWAGGHQISRQAFCETGKTTLINVKDIFEEIYAINHAFVGGASYLAGGLSTHYIPQGYVMVGIAPNQNNEINKFSVLLTIEGRKSSQPKLLPWQQMLVRAKLNLFSAPHLSVILSLNSVDLFIEHFTGTEMKSLKDKGRPDLWSYHINNVLNVSLRDLLGKKWFKLIEKFVQVRNALAHGSNYLKKLPNDIREKEEDWVANGKYREGTANFSPCANFALRCSLKIIRDCRRKIENQ